MSEIWLVECVNCRRSTMVGSYGDNCQFCGKNVSKKEVVIVTKVSEERRPVPEKPRKRGKVPAYWEKNKVDILTDYHSMRLKDFFDRWSMSTTTWIELKKLWEVKGKRSGTLTTGGTRKEAEAPRGTTSPGGVALEAIKALGCNEHEEYLILKGYQLAVREMLAAIGGENITSQLESIKARLFQENPPK